MLGVGGASVVRTNTMKVALAVRPPLSVTRRTMSFSPLLASQPTVMTALTEPLLLVMDETVMPLGTVVAGTVSEPALSSASLTAATVVLVAGSPWARPMGDAAVIDGAVFAAAS